MKIIDRYLSRQLAGSFAGFGLVLAGLAWMVQLLLLLKLIVRNGLDIGGFLGMSLYTFPMLVGIIAPFVMFISVAFVYNRAISSSEITACYGAGLRPMALARPAIRTGFIVMVLHLASNLWLAPKTQDLFYGRQWELRYGLGQLKLKEAQFSQLMDGVVIYVERVFKRDLRDILIRDARADERIISSATGRLVSTANGLSIVMGAGGLQTVGKSARIIGTFDSVEMDMGLSGTSEVRLSRPRRASTPELVSMIKNPARYQASAQKVMAEAANRFISPLLDLLFALLGAAFLLKSGILRRRSSYSILAAALAVAAIEVAFMSASTSIDSLRGLAALGGGLAACIVALLAVFRK